MKLMVIDGNSIVNRAFYGVRMLNAADGTPTNAVFGFLNIFRRLMQEENPDSVCVTFDLPAPTFRHLQYDGYKAQRKGMPDELAVQMPILKEVLDAMNVRRLELSGWEADDIIGTVTRISGEAGYENVIVTGDKDSFQLINGCTAVKHVKSRMGQTEVKLYDEETFTEEYGFAPPMMVDLKALMGDASDNIPGVAGVGEKTAMDLVRRFGTVRELYEALDSAEIRDSVKKKLDAGRDMAEMSYELATIRRDAPIKFLPEEAKVSKPDNDRLWEIFQRLGFRKLIEQYGLTPPINKKVISKKEKEVYVGESRCVEIKNEADMAEFRKVLKSRCAVVFSDDMTVFAVQPEDDDMPAFTAEVSSPFFTMALKALTAPDVRKMGHNIKDTMGKLISMGCSAEGWVFDTALAAYLLDPTVSSYDLGRLAEDFCGFTIMDGAEEDGQFSLLDDGIKLTARLLSEASAILAIAEEQTKQVEEAGLSSLFYDVEVPLCPVLARMENAGFLVDRDALGRFEAMLTAETDRLTKSIYELAGEEFNINSPKQLGEVLFTKLMLPAPKKTKTGYSTNADVLEKLRKKHPIVDMVLEYRELSKLRSTYAVGLQKVIAEDGRIHTSFQMTVTATGRLSSTEPNLQNIPVRRELGGEIRKMFMAPENMVLVDADYSQIELRILAHMSGDETMRAAFISGEDIHRITAAQVMGISPEDVTPALRSRAKAVNFGIVYGISAFSLADDLGIPVSDARDYINAYMAKYSGVREYMERVCSEAKAEGYARTLYGRRRPMPELRSTNFNVRSFGERVARNMPIQGTAADIMKIAMIRADRALSESGLKARLILQVHDELIAECPEEEREKVSEILQSAMSGAAELSVPIPAEAHSGRTWYEAK